MFFVLTLSYVHYCYAGPSGAVYLFSALAALSTLTHIGMRNVGVSSTGKERRVCVSDSGRQGDKGVGG